MVVEAAAAEFFEGRVLDAVGVELRVEEASRGAVQVPVDEAYALPPRGDPLRAGQLAVCRTPSARWLPCRVQRVGAAGIDAVDLRGERLTIDPASVLRPTPLTELNLKRAFERADERARFADETARAGAPRAPTAWHARPHERVLIEIDGAWYGGTVHEIDHEVLHLLRGDGDRAIELPRSRVLPAPPYAGFVPSRGRYALRRPESVREAWAPVRVEGFRANAVDVVDAQGVHHDVSVAELVPLGAP